MMKLFIIKLLWFLNAQLGLDLVKFLYFISGMFRYCKDYYKFSKLYDGSLTIKPCIHDWYEEAGATKNEYFWQDLCVAKMISEAKPVKHVDIGSRIDGFVAHVASFRNVEVFDVRPITTDVPGVSFKQADLIQPIDGQFDSDGYCDSLSCLHAIEHFGLGRYGDLIVQFGFEQGLKNMAYLLKSEGIFYLSTPIGKERVEFNANYVFDPRTIINCSENYNLKLHELYVIAPKKGALQVQINESNLFDLAQTHYNLGLFIFKKIMN